MPERTSKELADWIVKVAYDLSDSPYSFFSAILRACVSEGSLTEAEKEELLSLHGRGIVGLPKRFLPPTSGGTH